jgi:ABC-2 type transport system ATP-binding protein
MTRKGFNNSSEFVVLRDVTKKFGSFCALSKISLGIREGEIFGYIGPNGAGKTTTMKIIVGLISDFQGEVFIGDYQVPQKKNEIHKLLGYLPQNVAFQEWRTVNHALKTFGKLSGLGNEEVEKRISDTLDLLGLADVRYKKITQLSGGMIQKVGLAQALLHEPKLLVLDEPLGGLDPLSRRQFKDIVLKLGQKGTTVLFSSHILSDVQDVADRIGIINRGRIMQIGTLDELKSYLMHKKTIEILLSRDGDEWKKLGSIKNVKSVEEPSPRRVLVNLEPDSDEERLVNDVVQSIVKLGIRVRGVALLEPSLDEIYLSYVQEAENS